MKQLTVRDLANQLAEAVRDGYGDKLIIVGDDNEGNGYHGLFYGLTVGDIVSITENGELIYDSVTKDLRKLVILG